MASTTTGDRTEEATPERLKKAREEGKIPVSAEVPSAMMCLALLLAMAVAGPWAYQWFVHELKDGLTMGGGGRVDFSLVLASKAQAALVVSLPFLLAAAAASFLGSVAVGGLSVGTKALKFDFSRIAFGGGLKALFSTRSIMVIVVGAAKLSVISLIIYAYLQDKMENCMTLRWAQPQTVLSTIGTLAIGILIRVTIAMVAIAMVDLFYQKWKFKREMRMTRREVKDERRHYELAPEIRGRIRAIQIAMVRKRMLKKVAKADIVVVNPTHVAVAIKYDGASMPAPQVMAKGAGVLCEKIKEIARNYNVPIVERPELARALYKAVEVDQFIPQALFVAVAEVLAMIYRMRKKRI
jgi:flagellar biosynthetic protein FlhB